MKFFKVVLTEKIILLTMGFNFMKKGSAWQSTFDMFKVEKPERKCGKLLKSCPHFHHENNSRKALSFVSWEKFYKVWEKFVDSAHVCTNFMTMSIQNGDFNEKAAFI